MKLNWIEKLAMNSPLRTMVQRKEAQRMLQLGGDLRGKRVLEIGCGRGAGVEIIFDTFSPLCAEAFDFDRDQVRLAKQRLLGRYPDRVNLFVASATKIPYRDNYFDAVFDFGALHHIPDNDTAISEISRVLKPEGRFLFMEMLSSLTMNPIVCFLTRHPPEAQFTWEELSMKLADSGLVVSENSCTVGGTRAVGVACKSK